LVDDGIGHDEIKILGRELDGPSRTAIMTGGTLYGAFGYGYERYRKSAFGRIVR
jgi:hypothetical protein